MSETITFKRALAAAKKVYAMEVASTGVGKDDAGNYIVRAYVRDEADLAGVPASVDGVPVAAMVVGEVRAFGG